LVWSRDDRCHASVDGLAPRLEEARLAQALAKGPKLLLADESLGGLTETEMDAAATATRKIRDELGITIIWVEHIMGVLMRVSIESWCAIRREI